jgi:uncharacterized protein YlzI (FlbEa/FlbD family)
MMTEIVVAIALEFLVLRTLDGRDVAVNPAHVVSVSNSRPATASSRLMTYKVRCVIALANGAKVSVAEECESVRARLQGVGR